MRGVVTRWLPHAAIGVTAVAAAIGGTLGYARRPHTIQVPGPAGALQVSEYSCGQNWTADTPHAGLLSLVIYNAGSEETSVDVIAPATGAVYGEVESLGVGTSGTIQVDLAGGQYALRCLPEDLDAVTGPTVRVTGTSADATPGVVPLTSQDLVPYAKQYETYVTSGVTALLPMVTALRDDIAGGDLAAARADWLTAHMKYETLGGAYDAFGDLGDAIDGLPNGLPQGVADPGFTGFHRIEYGLWHGQSMAELLPLAGKLVTDVTSLRGEFARQEIDPLDLGLRSHEILEDALRFELTGQSDQGSGTALATVSSEVAGTRELLGILQPVLASRYPQLPQVYTWLDRLDTELAAVDQGGAWTPLASLTQTQREDLDSTVSQTVELLAPIAVITEPRRTT